MKAMAIGNIMVQNDLGWYDFIPEAWAALVEAGLVDADPETGAEWLDWDSDDNGGVPDGAWLMTEDRVGDYEAVKAILARFDCPEIEVEKVEAGRAYGIIRDALDFTAAEWMGYSKDDTIYVSVD